MVPLALFFSSFCCAGNCPQPLPLKTNRPSLNFFEVQYIVHQTSLLTHRLFQVNFSRGNNRQSEVTLYLIGLEINIYVTIRPIKFVERSELNEKARFS